MRRSVYLVVVMQSLYGCSKDVSPAPGANTSETARASSTESGGLAIAYTSSDNAARLDEIFSGLNPKDFLWYKLDFASGVTPQLSSPNGLVVDFAHASGVSFSQVYRDECNPALQDHEPCFLFESYTSGDPGLTGNMMIRYAGTAVEGSLDITWAGNTDRYGQPIQWTQHQTLAGLNADISQEGSAP